MFGILFGGNTMTLNFVDEFFNMQLEKRNVYEFFISAEERKKTNEFFIHRCNFYVRVKVDLFVHAFILLFNRADGFIRVYDCVFVMGDGSRVSHELRRSVSKKAKLEELSKNICEIRCELKASEPLNERSERTCGYIVGNNYQGVARRDSGKSAV